MNRPTSDFELLWFLSLVLLAAIGVVGVSTLPTRDRVRELERRVEVMEAQHAAFVAVMQGLMDEANAEKTSSTMMFR